MKLKNVIGILAVTVLACNMTAMVYAAENYITIGKAINAEKTGEISDEEFAASGKTFIEEEEFNAGDIIALPVDVTSASGKLTAFGTVVEYDPNYVEAGVDDNDMNVVSDNAYTGMTRIAGKTENFVRMPSGIVCALQVMGTPGRNGAVNYVGSPTCNNKYTINGNSNHMWYGWYHTASVATNDKAEVYLMFRVIKDVDSETLNQEVFKAVDEQSNAIQDSNANIDLIKQQADASAAKANACYGAFNINIDSSALPYWIQGLKVAVNGGSKVAVTEYKSTDNVNFTFPVRVVTNSTNAEKATVEVFADTSSDEAGSNDVQNDVSMGTFDITLNSPTAYENNNVSAQ